MKPRDHERKKAWQAGELAAARARVPAPESALAALFAAVEEALARTPCDHSRRASEAAIVRLGLPRQPVLDWLLDLGGGCDCEVLLNVESSWRELRREDPPRPVPPPRPRPAPAGPAPKEYVDAALRLPLPGKPWKPQRAAAVGALLDLAFGDARVRLLDPGGVVDEAAWCEQRACTLKKAASHWPPKQADDEVRRYIVKFGYQVSTPEPFAEGALSGRVRRFASPGRTEAYLWWHLDLPGGRRIVELETESQRLADDWKELRRLLAAATLPAS